MRQIVLDTETTGLEVEQQHRIIEIGCVELFNRRLTGRSFHRYLNPERDIDEGAESGARPDARAALAKEPTFLQVHLEFLEFIRDAELIIHNAPFDVAFLNAELARSAGEACGSQTYAGCSTPWRSRGRCIPGSATAWMPCASATRWTIRIATITVHCSTRASSPKCIWR